MCDNKSNRPEDITDEDLVMSWSGTIDEFYQMMEAEMAAEAEKVNEESVPETKTRRLAAGEYEVTLKGAPAATNHRVSISLVEFWDGPGWVASANWDNYRYTDPLRTKREAVVAARHMLSKKDND